MKTLKMNFTISEDTVSRLKNIVPEGNRSGFVGMAIEEKLDQIEREQFLELMKEGYLARRQEDIESNQEWDAATSEGWP
jgi:hypothetical protein